MFYFTLNSVTWHVYCFCINDGTENTRSTENKAHLQKTSGSGFVDPRQTGRQADRLPWVPWWLWTWGFLGYHLHPAAAQPGPGGGLDSTLRPLDISFISRMTYKKEWGWEEKWKSPSQPPSPFPWSLGAGTPGGGGGRCHVPRSH